MGSASCKNSKAVANATAPKKEEIKRISIAVFGLENAGKTTTVKALQGAPTKTSIPDSDAETSTVAYPASLKMKDKKQERIEIIDVSGKENFREYSWADYYDRIHGFIFVVDASDKKRMLKNKSVLGDLLRNSKLRGKPLLILANKQDLPNAIKDENHLKEKLEIEDIHAIHKIVFCEAVPANKKKAASSICEGFAWLIKEIEKDFTKLNDRVVPPKGSARGKPPTTKRIGAYGAKPNHTASDDDDLVYGGTRRSTPPPSSRIGEHRSPNTSIRLPQIDLNKSKRKPGGYETYSDNDDAKDDRIRSRPIVSVPTSDRNERDRFGADSLLDNSLPFNKKKKVIGSTNSYHDTPGKRIMDLDTKAFRSSYESFPDDPPLSGSLRRITKPEGSTSAGNALRIPPPNDPFKRSVSPLVHDWKSQKSDTLTKRDKGSDDDEIPYPAQRDKSKSLYPLSSKSRDDDYSKYTTPLSSSKPTSTYKKPTSGLYGSDDEDYGRRTTSVPARLPTSTSTVGARKPYKPDDDSDNDDPYRKKTTFGASRPLGSDDDDRTNDKYKPNDRSRFNNGYHGSTTDSSMPSRVSRSPAVGNDYLSKTTPPKNRFGIDDDDERPSASSRIGNYPKYDIDDDYKSSSKPTASSRYNNDRPSSPVRNTSLSRLNDSSSRNPVSSKPPARSTFEDDDDDDDYRRSSPPKASSRTKFEDDDDYRPGTLTKVPSRSKLNEYDDDDHRPLGTKTSSRSKFEDDDDYADGSDSRFRSGNNGRIGSGTTSRPRNGSMYDF